MILKHNLARHLMSTAMRAPEGEGGAAAAAPAGGAAAPAAGAAAPAADPAAASVFPNEGGEKKPDDPAAGDKPADGDKKPDAAAGWKEYVADPKKSDADNATAKAEHDKTKPAAAAGDKVPDDGKYQLAMPEGVQVDQAMVDALGPEFKELGLTNAQAQKLADKFIEVQAARVKTQGEDWGKTLTKWVDDAKADKEIGGDKWDGTVTTAMRAVDRLGTPALKEYLEASGGGNHPELIRFMAKVGAMIREDDPAAGGAEGKGKPADPAHLLFPGDAPKG